ncbi:hypothetical protein HU200_056582 [Digitaria exilis]|uniref:Mediator of RNA polymerase II transcription subunit 20 n=1 Tax=Digitaria exilis TaxID=1010633 RepID=A0A835ACG4_9POAL|nr:hypothetical protein HU200_056582 [Digitaria exilis]
MYAQNHLAASPALHDTSRVYRAAHRYPHPPRPSSDCNPPRPSSSPAPAPLRADAMPSVKWYRVLSHLVYFPPFLPPALSLTPRFSAAQADALAPEPRGDAQQPDPRGGVRLRGVPGRRQGRALEDLHLLLPPHDPGRRGGQQGQTHADLPRELLGVALHDRPGLYFSIVRAAKLVLQADAAFPQVMEKLQSYKARVALNFEVTSCPFWFQI